MTEYRYHATLYSSLLGIKRRGLVPSKGMYERGVYFAQSIKETGGYGIRREVFLRVLKKDLERYDYGEWKDDEGWTEEVVPPEVIEVKVDGDWKRLEEIKIKKLTDGLVF